MRQPPTLSAIISVLALGCGTQPPAWNTPLHLDGPHKVGAEGDPHAGLMWVDGTRGWVFALDPGQSPPVVKHTKMGHNPTFVTVSPTRRQLLVLTAGKEALRKGETAESPALAVIQPSPQGPEVTRSYPLQSAFDRLAVSPDGTLAVAYYSNMPSTGDAVFRNPNELAIFDLGAAPSAANPTFRTIRSLGSAPLGIVFSPPLAIPSGAPMRTLALVLSQNYLTFLDLTNRQRAEITVPLARQDASAVIVPQQVLFAINATGDAMAFVRADGSPDVFQLALDARATKDPQQNDFLPHVNQPSSGKTALDMIAFTDGPRSWLLTANTTQDLSLIDTQSGAYSFIPVGAPVDAILPLPAGAPTMAVLFSRGTPQSFVHFLDLKNLAANLERNLVRRSLAQPVHDLIPVPGGAQLLVVHDNDRTVISILDLGPHRTDTPIEGQLRLESFDFAGSAFLAGVTRNLNRLGILDLATLNPHDLRLDDAPVQVMAVNNHLLVDHGADAGRVTVVPDPMATREESTVLWGFFLQGVLDEDLRN